MKCNWISLIVNWSLISFPQWRRKLLSSKTDTKGNMFAAWIRERRSVPLLAPDCFVLIATVQTDITFCADIHGLEVEGWSPDFSFSAPMRLPLFIFIYFRSLLFSSICFQAWGCVANRIYILASDWWVVFCLFFSEMRWPTCFLAYCTWESESWGHSSSALQLYFVPSCIFVLKKKTCAFVSAGI